MPKIACDGVVGRKRSTLAAQSAGNDNPAEFLGTCEDRTPEELSGNNADLIEKVVWTELVTWLEQTASGGTLATFPLSALNIR